MDNENLIEKLQNAAGGPEGIKMCHDAATTISALQAENEKQSKHIVWLNDKLEIYKNKVVPEWRTENEKLRAELEQAKRERDAAVDCCSGYCASCLFVKDCAKHDMNDAAPTRWYYGDCEDWEWRGWKEG